MLFGLLPLLLPPLPYLLGQMLAQRLLPALRVMRELLVLLWPLLPG